MIGTPSRKAWIFIFMKDNKEYLDNLRHSCAHLLAAAVMEIWPGTKRAIGPSIENGFYFDFDFGGTKISEADFPKIEKKMHELVKSWNGFERQELTSEQAKKEYPNNPYKHELIDEFSETGKKKISFYKSGNYRDLCRGGHIENPKKELQHFKLMSVAGAYWRGSEKNPMLTRIYGTAWPSKEELDQYLARKAEAEKRDHKRIGPQLELFMFHHTSPGMPYWLPKGVVIYNQLINFWRLEHQSRGYQEIISPLINKKELYQTSGHYDHYWKDMFVADMGEQETYGVKAMNCPNAMVVFGSRNRSYRDLPLRLSDTDTLHRYEPSGTLNGLLRVREFRQDDAHIFVSEDMIEAEYKRVFEIVERFYSIFAMDYSFRLGTRPKEYLGDAKTWNEAEKTLKHILENSKQKFTVAEGDGAFYGPKVDIIMKDALGRDWQMGTVQLDFQQPKRFNLEYTAPDGTKKTPIAIHRVIYGSMERFIGILIEHFAGAFPLWLSPVQVAVLPISDKQVKYAQKIVDGLNKASLRVEFYNKAESVGKKIREAEMQKIPYMLIIGEKEQKAKSVSVRARNQKDLGAMKLDKFLAKVQKEIETKSLT